MSMHFVILNGPPRSGKDTLAGYCQRLLGGQQQKFIAPLYAYMEHCHGMTQEYCERHKDTKLPQLGGCTIREELINFSERYFKPRFGQDIYGRLMCRRLVESRDLPYYVWVTDLGFHTELIGLLDEVVMRRCDSPKCTVIHLQRDGYTFNNDSRSYVYPEAHGIPASLHVVRNIEGQAAQAAQEICDIASR